MMGTELTINGTTLYAGRVPGRKSPALGMREGSTLAVLGYFISESECEHFERWMESMSGTFVFDGKDR